MEDLLADLLQSTEFESADWDNEFYVSISKASELSGLSQSQIRYFESLKGVNIGKREGPNERNRVYTKRDVQLLRWVYRHNKVRPAELSNFLSKYHEEIFERLGQVTLPQLIKREGEIAGYDKVIADIATMLLAIWRSVVPVGGATLQGVILGPGDRDWFKAFQDNLSDKSRSMIDLKECLVIWPASSASPGAKEDFVFYSQESWYLPLTEELVCDTSWCSKTEESLSVVFVWNSAHTPTSQKAQKEVISFELDTTKKTLAIMLLASLSRVLAQRSRISGEPVSAFSRSAMGSLAILQGLSVLLDVCIRPYFANCYLYVAELGEHDEVKILRQVGDTKAGYIYPFLDSKGVLDTHKIPWWIRLAKEQVVIALDRDARRRPESREEKGSVVCIPLVRQDRVIGVVGVETPGIDEENHCLATRDGFDGSALLRYLICMAEIAADYLDLSASSTERVERAQVAYTSEEMSKWHLNLYEQGGVNYSEVIEKILDWAQQVGIKPEDRLDVVIFDIAEDDKLAREYKGFDIITKIVQTTRERIQNAIERDSTLSNLIKQQQLILFDEPVADHLVLATIRTPTGYLLVSLERLRKLWDAPNDTFTWEGKKVEVSLQVGVCKFSELGSHDKDIASELMKHHLWTIGQEFNQRHEHIIVYDAEVFTEKVKE